MKRRRVEITPEIATNFARELTRRRGLHQLATNRAARALLVLQRHARGLRGNAALDEAVAEMMRYTGLTPGRPDRISIGLESPAGVELIWPTCTPPATQPRPAVETPAHPKGRKPA